MSRTEEVADNATNDETRVFYSQQGAVLSRISASTKIEPLSMRITGRGSATRAPIITEVTLDWLDFIELLKPEFLA